jgi:hypothetical protein
MNRALSMSTVIMALAACSPAAAVAPDSQNPAHCIAAFNYGAYWFKVGKRPEKVTAMVARGIFEMNKIKASGGSVADARAEGEALTKAYANDQNQMDALFVACGSAQDADAQFKAQLPSLLVSAREAQARYQ